MKGRTGRVSTDQVISLQVGGGDYPDFPSYMTLPKDPEMAQEVIELYRWVLTTRSANDWGPDSSLVAEFAMTTVRLASYQAQLDRDGPTVKGVGSKGQPVDKRHPCLDAITSLGNRQIALARTLSITGLPSSKRSVRNQAKRGGNFSEPEAAAPKGKEPDWTKRMNEARA